MSQQIKSKKKQRVIEISQSTQNMVSALLSYCYLTKFSICLDLFSNSNENERFPTLPFRYHLLFINILALNVETSDPGCVNTRYGPQLNIGLSVSIDEKKINQFCQNIFVSKRESIQIVFSWKSLIIPAIYIIT